MPTPSDDSEATRPLVSESPVPPSTSERAADTQRPAGSLPHDFPDDVHADLALAFGDRYAIGDKLGEGGFGSVYRGFDKRLKRPVAVKAARTDQGPLADAARLTQEAQRVAQLRHPGIVSVQDVAIGGRRCFIVSELLAGPNLHAWLSQRRPGWSEAAAIAASVADALAHAHARGIIHRDIKPGNIILLDGTRPVLVDFGIALSAATLADDLILAAGTPDYMPPEQARGLGGRPDGRADVYSLAVTLYEMLAGRPPFQADDTPALLRLVRDAEPPPLRSLRADVPADLEAVCRKAMAKHPGDRFATALEFASALRNVIHRTHTALVEPPDPEGDRTPLWIPPATDRKTPTDAAPERFTPGGVRKAETERRQVSILSASFEPAATADLDDAHEQFLAFQASCRAIITGCDGRVLPSSGATILAVFGYPTVREDAPRQAVRAALAIATRLAARAAVHSGLAVVTEAPDGSLTVIGDVTAGVARLDPLFVGSDVLITEATRRLVDGYFECEAAGEVKLRSDGVSSSVHRVVSERIAHNRVDAADPARLTPLIGRDREVGLLRERWELAAEGHGHVVLLVADPGLGKSRLVRDIREHVASAGTVIAWHGSAAHQNSPLYPIVEYWERVLGFDREADPDRRLDRLIRRLRDDGLDDAEHVALFAGMLSLPGSGRLPALNLSPDRLKERIRESLIEWLRLRAEKQSVLFVVEDLHWVDPSTLDVLGRVVEQCHDLPLLAIFTARPEFEPPWKAKTDVTQVALTRLTRRQVGEMIRAQSATPIPSETAERIAERTDGVPLFVEEFARVVIENGNAAAIPATLQDLLLARLDRTAGDKELVHLAAAIDRTFTFELLQAASERSVTVLSAELQRLVAAGLLFAKGHPPRCSYTFKHALIQDAAYQSMVKKRRQHVHRQIATAIEKAFADIAEAQPELLAHHFTEAGDSERAVDYWLGAGQRARERSAYLEAIRQLARGLQLLLACAESEERDARELDFRMPLAACFIATRGYASSEVAEQIARLNAIRSRLERADHYFPIRMLEWSIAFITGRIEQAQRIANGFVGLAEMDCSDGLRTEAHWAAGCTAWWAGDFPAAWRHLERADLLYRVDAAIEYARFTQQNSGPLLMAYAALSLWMLGYPEMAHEKTEAALALADDLKHPFTLAAALWVQALLTQLAGDSDAALAVTEKMIALSEAQSFAFWKALALGVKGAALAALGRDAEAVPLLRDSLARVEATGCEKFHQHTLHALAGALWRLGERDRAWAELNRAIALNDRDKERLFEAELHRLKARFHAESEPPDEYDATVSLVHAIEVARGQSARWFELRAALDLGRLCAATRPREAREFVETALDGLTEGLDSRLVIDANAVVERLKRDTA